VDAGEERRRSAYGARTKVDEGGGWVVPCASAGRGRIQRRRGHASCGREGGGVRGEISGGRRGEGGAMVRVWTPSLHS
jgi:hypothetical protein